MAPPGINLITTVASRLYALAPAPPPGLRFHSAPLPSPATSTEEGGSSSSPPRAEYPFGRETGQSVGDSTGTDAGSDRASGASAGRPEPTRVAGSSTTVIGGSGASNGSPWDDDGGDVSSEGTARQRSTERPGGKSDAYGRAPARSPTAASAAATHPTTVDDDYARHRWRPASSHGSRASSFKSVQDGLAKAERDAEERDEVRALAADGDDGDDDDAGSDDSGESDDDCVVLVQTPYHIVLRNYSLVPVLSILALAGIVTALTLGWPPSVHSPDTYPHRPMWRQALFGLAFHSLSHSLRIPLFQLLALVLPGRLLPSAHTALHTLALETVRFGALILVVPRLEGEDRWRWPDVWRQWPAFAGSVWFGLGWAVGEVAVGIWQGYRHLSYYKPVLPSSERAIALRSRDEEMQLANGRGRPYDDTTEDDDDEDSEDGSVHKGESRLAEQVWELIAVQKREEVEAVLGVPLPNIPSIVSALWRLDSLFLALGITLILSALYARHEDDDEGRYLVPPHTLPLFAAVAVGHATISVGWLVGIKTIGAPATTYISLLVALGTVVWGLLSWGALV